MTMIKFEIVKIEIVKMIKLKIVKMIKIEIVKMRKFCSVCDVEKSGVKLIRCYKFNFKHKKSQT